EPGRSSPVRDVRAVHLPEALARPELDVLVELDEIHVQHQVGPGGDSAAPRCVRRVEADLRRAEAGNPAREEAREHPVEAIGHCVTKPRTSSSSLSDGTSPSCSDSSDRYLPYSRTASLAFPSSR